MSKILPQTQLRTIWFDLGNVILPFDFGPAFKRLSRHGTEVLAIRRFFKERPWLEAACDTGEVNAMRLYRMLKKHFEWKRLSYLEFGEIWNDIFKENREVSRLIRDLRKRGFRLILVSNTNKLHFDHIAKTYPVMKHFHHHVLSYKIKTRKPERKMFRGALAVSKAKKHEIFYTDDRSDFTDAAAAHGVHVHTFKHASGLKRALKKHGVHA
ncbi:MAG: HAD family phosphatase [Candidatus Omnitrophica bacterium]|nr:HAD family phosphatase [Candidatus Omnitrophota bacterium]